MPTYRDTREFARLREQVAEPARRRFDELVAEVDLTAANAAEIVHAIADAVMRTFGAASAELGALWLRTCADIAAGELMYATASDTLHKHVGWALGEVAGGRMAQPDAKSSMTSKAGECVISAADETIVGNMPAGTIYTRVAAPGACAFCTMAAAELKVTKKGDRPHFHDGCRCVTVPATRPDQIAGYERRFDECHGMYERARDDLKAGNVPEELKRRIEDARAAHYERTDEPWTSANSILIVMREQNGIN